MPCLSKNPINPVKFFGCRRLSGQAKFFENLILSRPVLSVRLSSIAFFRIMEGSPVVRCRYRSGAAPVQSRCNAGATLVPSWNIRNEAPWAFAVRTPPLGAKRAGEQENGEQEIAGQTRAVDDR